MIKKLNYVLTGKQKTNFFILVILTLIGTALELLGVSLIVTYVDALMNPEKLLEISILKMAYDKLRLQSVSEFVIALTVAVIFIYVFKNVYLLGMTNVQYRYVYNNKRRVMIRMMDCYLRQPYLYHIGRNSAEIIRNINSDTTMFFENILQVLHMITDGSTALILLVYLLSQDAFMTMVLAILMLIFVVIITKSCRKRSKEYGILFRKNALELNKWILQAFGGIKEVKIMNKEDYFLKGYEKVRRQDAFISLRMRMFDNIPKYLMETVCIGGMLGAVAFKVYQGVDLQMFIPVISAFAVAAFRIMPTISRMTAAINTLNYNKSAVDKIYDDLKNTEEYEGRLLDNHVKAEGDLKFADKIAIKDVTFRYPNTEKLILNKVNMEIPKNRSVALIGPSGGGKTTLADIILGILPTEKGEISVDGVDIQKNIHQWYGKIGYIPQAIYLTDDTIRRNIAFGVDDNKIDEEQVIRALKEAQLYEFVMSLDNGLDTQIGERGVRLSGGQRQRIGIARALYTNPELLILDEATSALDNDTEKAVMEAIDSLAGSKTMLIIAHRLSTIKNCDYIYKVSEGNVELTQLE